MNMLGRRRGMRPREVAGRCAPAIEVESSEGNEYPVLALHDTVVFPNLVTPLFIGRDRSVWAVEAAEAMQRPLLVVAQRDPELTDPTSPTCTPWAPRWTSAACCACPTAARPCWCRASSASASSS